jgi:UDP-N-acetylglucosamine enolpyruvyl transferase
MLALQKACQGANIKFPLISVGATESIVIAAVLAKGVTKISNAALEPEIVDLINFLNKCGADIQYNSRRKIIIKGVKFFISNKTQNYSRQNRSCNLCNRGTNN